MRALWFHIFKSKSCRAFCLQAFVWTRNQAGKVVVGRTYEYAGYTLGSCTPPTPEGLR